ncbi:putative pentatricopeptide repeat-containing protein At3g18840 [Andrographis paniculata]|uniref:putative pentatricopeptide repeat-containing protein At3g18840 n=1 Tax=Andrographis paniculata TaxID=175694 RepID=UPI0021E99006|nr:putative pentatricopeptide repeat-containing protein At3g18840 [Andrographis paniculata]
MFMYLRSLKEALQFHALSIKSGRRPPVAAANNLIHLYSKHGLTHDARKVFDEMPQRNIFSWNTILHAHVAAGDFDRAKAVFDSSPCRDSVSFNTMISGYAHSGDESDAVELFVRMQSEGGDAARVDEFTVSMMLNLAANLGGPVFGREMHSIAVKTGNDSSGFVSSALIYMYSNCGFFPDACRVVDDHYCRDSFVKNALLAACCREGEMGMAREVFTRNPDLNDVVSWNTLISGYVQSERDEEVVEMCVRAIESGIRWNCYTFAALLSACGALRWSKLGKEVHGRVLRDGIFSNPYLSSGVVDVYAKCSEMRYAERVYRVCGQGNVFATTSMIVGYSTKGDMLSARQLFDMLPNKNFVVWTSIISGYAKLQRCEEAFILFREYAVTTFPDSVILVVMLSACATSATVGAGKEIHAHMLRTRTTFDEKATSALMDMYCKSGVLSYAKRAFERFSTPDIVVYNVMIAGFAHHGHDVEAIELFDEMVDRGINPDAVTFVALLSACRHRALVERGESYFSSMIKIYGIEPEMDHYACMVDLYGRSNRFEEAVAFIERMPVEPDPIVASAFLSCCRNVEATRKVEGKLLGAEGGGDPHGGRYVQVARAYARGGLWAEMGRVMREMRGREVKKVAGCSWVHVAGGVHTFISGDRSHSQAEAIYRTLDCLTGRSEEERNEFFLDV